MQHDSLASVLVSLSTVLREVPRNVRLERVSASQSARGLRSTIQRLSVPDGGEYPHIFLALRRSSHDGEALLSCLINLDYRLIRNTLYR
jgi:hypothetical protein